MRTGTTMPCIGADKDGIANHKIADAFRERGIRGDSRMSRAYQEVMYASSAFLIRRPAASYVRSVRPNTDFVDLTRTALGEGVLTVVQTANPLADRKSVKAWFKGIGAKVHDVETVSRNEKGREGNGVSFRVFIEDDPIDALMVARRGIPVILLLTNYNGLGSRLVSLINKNIHLVRNLGPETQTFAIEHAKSTDKITKEKSFWALLRDMPYEIIETLRK